MANFEEYKDIWVYTEQRGGKLMNVAREVLGEGHKLSREIDAKVCALLIGSDVQPEVGLDVDGLNESGHGRGVKPEKLLPAFLRELDAHTRCFEEELCDPRHAIEHRCGAGKRIELHAIASNQLI